MKIHKMLEKVLVNIGLKPLCLPVMHRFDSAQLPFNEFSVILIIELFRPYGRHLANNEVRQLCNNLYTVNINR